MPILLISDWIGKDKLDVVHNIINVWCDPRCVMLCVYTGGKRNAHSHSDSEKDASG